MRSSLTKIKELIISGMAWISGLTIFIPFGLSIISASLFIDPKKLDRFIKASCRLVLRFLFIRIKIEGLNHFQAGKTYLFIGNHVNLFDPFVLYGHIPNFFRGVELDEHFNWFFYGLLIRRLGMIPISQSNSRAAYKSLVKAKQAIAAGTSILILPEGGRSLDGTFRPFKPGAFRLAKEANVDIVPLVMVGAYQINYKGSLLIRPGKMTLCFGKPIPLNKIKTLSVNELSDYVRSIMLALFNR
jgi:1-acyl-sn-glycerol-3-phosphate acyltransferase